MANNNTGVAKADKCEEQADAGTDTQAQAGGHSFKDPAPELARAQCHK